MKKHVMIGLLVGTIAIVSGCGSQTPTPTPTPPTPTTQNAPATVQPPAPSTTTPTPTTTTTASGKDVYDKNCSACHGAGGAGAASGPALNSEKRIQAQVLDITKKGKGSMPAFAGKLSDTEIQAVSQYVADLKK